MPVKTKAQKIAAEERREKIQYSLPLNGAAVIEAEKAIPNATDYSYVRTDLKRIGLFTALAFGVEIFLWFLLKVR